MDVHQSHATMLRNPIEFSLPNVDGLFPQMKKERGILRQGVRKLDVAGAGGGVRGPGCGVRTRSPEGKDGVGAVWLRLKRVGVERGGVVENIEIVQPVQIMKHEP